MLCFALSDISHLPEGNSSSLLIETLIASCNRVICMFLAPTSALICWFSCRYSCSSSVFFCCDSSYVCLETQPANASTSPAKVAQAVIDLFITTSIQLRETPRSSIGRLIECIAPALHAGLKGKVVVSQLFMLFPGRSHHAGVEGSSPSLFNQVRMMPGHPQEGWSP